jgi:hypothetical protein
MKTYKIKELYKALSTDSLLFDSYLTSFYPDIEGNESNFLTDYASGHAYFDKAFNQKYGERLIDLEAETVSAAITEARGIFSAVAMLNLANWARLYYALSLDYNPLYNVDGLTTFTHGATSATDSYGKDKTTSSFASRQDSTVYGDTSQTVGQHTNTDTDFSVAYDTTLEAETGKSTHDNAAVTTTETTHTDTYNIGNHNDTVERDARSDTHTTLQSIDTELRQGNIGVTKSTDLLQGTYDLYTQTRSFWETVFKAMVTEGGAYYDYSAL